ncbi:hypothetical protein TNCV_516161 [Trichonephila clavipes]|nr:hypothetical protein TNCV_516161 [Trichonephila clavipes]
MACIKRNWLDVYKWLESGLPVMESIPNKWYCHQEVGQGRHKASTLTQDRYMALRARQHKWTRVPQLVHDLAAVS